MSATSVFAQDGCSDFDPASTSKGPSPEPAQADRTEVDYNIAWIADHEIDGTAFDDQINAGDERNIIYAGGGNDVIHAGGGNDLIYAFGAADEPDFKEVSGGGGTDVVLLAGFTQPADFCSKPEHVDVIGTTDWGSKYKLKLDDVEYVGAIMQRLSGTPEFRNWLGPLISPTLPPLPPLSEQNTTFTYRLDNRSSVAVDLDNDGFDEIIVQTSEPGEVELNGVTYYYQPAELKIYSTDKLGALHDVTRAVLGAEPVLLDWSVGTIASDFNQDGYPDLFFCDSGYDPAGFAPYEEVAPLMVGRQNLLLLSDGNGQLIDVSSTHLPQLSDFCHGASSGDIDKDGDDDIWVSNLQSQYAMPVSYLLLNDGTGRFEVVADLGFGSDPPGQENYLEFYPYPDQRLPSSLWNESFTNGLTAVWWSSMVDANGDGADEIILWSAHSGVEGQPPVRDILLMNDGNGFFEEAEQGAIPEPIWGIPTASEGTESMDVNQDGLEDIFISRSYNAAAYQLLINNGDGTFADETSSRMPGVDDPSLPGSRNYSRLRIVDFDNDGDDDLSISIDFVSTFFVNDGTGHFTQQITVPELPFYHLPIDLKTDGATDWVAPVGLGNDKEQLTLGTYLNLNAKSTVNAGHSGAWYNPDTSGQGQLIDIEPESGFMFLAWFAYTEAGSANPSEQHWFTAQGNYSGNRALLPVYETLGGQFDDPAEVDPPALVGSIELTFDSCTSGQANYSVDSWGVTGSFPLTRVIPGSENVCLASSGQQQVKINHNDVWDGAWYNDDTPGQGFLIDSLSTSEGDDFIFVAWFTYGHDTASGQRWLTAQGPLTGNRAEVVVYETTGGSFDDPTPVNPSEVIGLMSIEFTGCNTAQLSYDLTDEGLSGNMDIIRVIPGTEALCESLVGTN
jgi:hypothetical protein